MLGFGHSLLMNPTLALTNNKNDLILQIDYLYTTFDFGAFAFAFTIFAFATTACSSFTRCSALSRFLFASSSFV